MMSRPGLRPPTVNISVGTDSALLFSVEKERSRIESVRERRKREREAVSKLNSG